MRKANPEESIARLGVGDCRACPESVASGVGPVAPWDVLQGLHVSVAEGQVDHLIVPRIPAGAGCPLCSGILVARSNVDAARVTCEELRRRSFDGSKLLAHRAKPVRHPASRSPAAVEAIAHVAQALRTAATSPGTGVVATRAGEDLQVLDVRLQQDSCPLRADRASHGHRGPYLVVVVAVHDGSQRDLLEVGLAARLSRLLTRAGEDREEDRRQNGDDGDHDQQFDQRETTLSHCRRLNEREPFAVHSYTTLIGSISALRRLHFDA